MYVHIPIKILGACQFIKLPSEMLTTTMQKRIPFTKIRTNTPRFCDRNPFSPCFNGISHFKKSSNANRKRNRFIRPRRNLPVSFCESAITIHHHRRGLQEKRIKFDIRGFASKNTRPFFPVSLIPVSSIKQNAAISNSNRGDSVFLSYEL